MNMPAIAKTRTLRSVSLLLLGLVALLTACERAAQPAESPQASTAVAPTQAPAKQGIAWFEGDVETAFATAAEQGKPVFVYWGARWCPPCNQLKSTVFTREDFIAQTRRYIAVQVDGDDRDAQRWAEHFGAMGYPTLIVFDSQGRERARLSSGMQLERYARILDQAIEAESVAELVARVRIGDALQAEQWERLAWHAWEVDQGRSLRPEAMPAFFRKAVLVTNGMPDLIRNRLIWLWWQAAYLNGDAQPEAYAIALGQQALGQMLQEPQQWAANLELLQYEGAGWIEALTAEAPEQRAQWLTELSALMDRIWEDSEQALKIRLLTLRAAIDIARVQQGEEATLPEELVQTVRERALQATAEADTPHLRQSLVYNAAWYLHEVGLTKEAETLLEAELQTAIAPHYYMSYLAEFAEARGDIQASLAWSARAAEEAKGPATRLQWQLAHLQRLLELQPAEDGPVLKALDELQQRASVAPGSLYQRSAVRLRRLDAPLRAWAEVSEERAQALRDWRQQWLPICDPLKAGTEAQAACQGLLQQL